MMNWILSKENITPVEAEEKIKRLMNDYLQDNIPEYEAKAMAISDLREEYDW